jgi:hypothetical protein
MGKSPRYPTEKKMDGHQSQSGHSVDEKYSTLTGNETPVVKSDHGNSHTTSITGSLAGKGKNKSFLFKNSEISTNYTLLPYY